jgi:Tripartite tricarboxylate transporter TctB family
MTGSTPEPDRPSDIEHLGFVAVLGVWMGWYLWNSAAASAKFENLFLVAPVGVLGLALVALIIGLTVFHKNAAPAAAGAIPDRLPVGRTRDAIAVIVAFLVFVAASPVIGFDLSTFFFMAAVMWYLGERRIVWIVGISLAVAVLLTAGALATLTYPLPTAILGRLWALP